MKRVVWSVLLAACVAVTSGGCPGLFTGPGPYVTLSAVGSPMAEDGGQVMVVARLSEPGRAQVTVHLSFGGAAVLGTDYLRSSSTISIPAGSRAGGIWLTGIADTAADGDMTIEVAIDSVEGALEEDQQTVTLTITDSGVVPTVTLAVDKTSISENGGVATVTATLSTAAGQDVTIGLALSGTAVANTDYTASGTGIVVPAGQTVRTLTLTGKSDAYLESDKTIVVTAGEAQNAVLDGPSEFTVVVKDSTPEETLQKGEAWLADNAQQPGVTVTASGLQYKILQEGDGPMPAATDTVNVIYRGTLIDGTEFDSSNGQAVPIQLSDVIPGWVEGLQLMPVGSRWMLYLPSDLAYGDEPAGQVIGPNSVLIFDVELVGIEGQ